MMLDTAKLDTMTRHIIIAGCESEAEALAAMRWLWPVLVRHGQPDPVMMICDTRDCDAARAAPVANPDSPPRWEDFDTAIFDHAEPVCHVLGGRHGLVVLADDADRAQQAIRALTGLASRLVRIPPDDPLMVPFNKSFAAMGVLPGQ
jgi:hypothetical protein